jgi:hypothetical protein
MPPTETTPHFVTIARNGRHIVLFTDARQGEWVGRQDRTALDWTQVVAVQFHVPAVEQRTVDFDFCIEDLAVLYVEGP